MQHDHIEKLMELFIESAETEGFLEYIAEGAETTFLTDADNITVNDLTTETIKLMKKTNENLGSICNIYFQKTNMET